MRNMNELGVEFGMMEYFKKNSVRSRLKSVCHMERLDDGKLAESRRAASGERRQARKLAIALG